MRHPDSPDHHGATAIRLMLTFLICLMLMEAISADRGEVMRFLMLLASGATKVVTLLRRMAVLVE
jgi:hypothetical protein